MIIMWAGDNITVDYKWLIGIKCAGIVDVIFEAVVTTDPATAHNLSTD